MSNYSRLQLLRANVDDVKRVITDNIDAIVERGQKLEEFADRSDRLQANCEKFRNSSAEVHRKVCLYSYKMTLLVVLAFVLVGGLLFARAHGEAFFRTTPTTIHPSFYDNTPSSF